MYIVYESQEGLICIVYESQEGLICIVYKSQEGLICIVYETLKRNELCPEVLWFLRTL